jgi:hypothetical protein
MDAIALVVGVHTVTEGFVVLRVQLWAEACPTEVTRKNIMQATGAT